MSNHVMTVDFFGTPVTCETAGYKIDLNQLFAAGNTWRLQNGKAVFQLNAFLNSVTLKDYVQAASKEWDLPETAFIERKGKGKFTKTYVHVSVAVLAAESISPEFHAKVHKIFVEGEILKFRALGGTEFVNLNAAIDKYLPGREDKTSNKGVYITVAKKLRAKILGATENAPDWNKASVSETYLRFDYEKRLCDFLKMGFIKDFEHLKEVIDNLK